MRRLFILYIAVVFAIVACDFSTAGGAFWSDSDSLSIKRYDRLQYRYLTTGDYSALQQMNADYPTETSMQIERILQLGTVNNPDVYKELYAYFRDSTLQTIITDAEKEFANIDDLNAQLRLAFGNLKQAYPGIEIPSFYAQLGALDQSIIIGDKSVCISLDKYLGKDYPIYKKFYPEDMRRTMIREYIVPDCIVFYLLSLHPMSNTPGLSQYDYDMHMGTLMYVANKMVGKKVINQKWVDKAEEYASNHSELSIVELLNVEKFD